MNSWTGYYGLNYRPGTFRIDETSVGTKLTFTNSSGCSVTDWPTKAGDSVKYAYTSRVPQYIKEAVVEYFADPKAFIAKIKEAGVTNVPGTMKPEEKPDIDAEEEGMEDYSEDDLNKIDSKAKDKGKETGHAMTEVPDKDLEQQKTKESKVNERTTPRIGDTVQVKDREGSTTVVPSAKVTDVDMNPDESFSVQLDGKEDWYDQGSYNIKILEPSNESKKVRRGVGIREQLRFCDSCNKTFRSNEVKCKCGSDKTEKIGEREYSGMNTGTKDVFKVEYTQDGQKAETRVMAYDEDDAKQYVERMKRGSKAISAKKVTSESKSKVNEVHFFEDSLRRMRASRNRSRKQAEAEGLTNKAGKKLEDFDKEQLVVGTKVEMEHTDDPAKAQQIAMDHLTEDPAYYIKLAKMEAGKCESKVNEDHDTIDCDRCGKSIKNGEIWVDNANNTVCRKCYLKNPSAEDLEVQWKQAATTSVPNEGKVPDDKDPEPTKIKKLIEGVTELVDEMDKLTVEDRQAIRRAIESGSIEDVWPTEDEMIDELSKLEDFVDPADIDSDVDIKMSYLKYVLVPKAISTSEAKVTEANLNEPAGFMSCVDRGGKVRTVSGPNKEHGLKEGEYVKYCVLDGKTSRGEVEHKKNESKVNEQEEEAFVLVAKGIIDRAEAEKIAIGKKGYVVQDTEDQKKWMVLIRKGVK